MRFINIIIVGLLLTAVGAEDTGWKLHPASKNGARVKVPDYTPTFEKHFTVKDGWLTGHCGLGNEIYQKHKVRPFEGVGRIWATNTAWPSNLKNFEMTLEYNWNFRSKPIRRVGDDPDMNIGIRLDPEGKGGYCITWGFLQQVRLHRTGSGGTGVGEGHQKRVKNQHIKLRIRAAGPIIKVKCWGASEPEPEIWTVETYDDQTGTHYESGAIALGFNGRWYFDTAEYHYRNIEVKELLDEEVAKEVFYDPKTAPAKRKVPHKRFPMPTKKIELNNESALSAFKADDNLIVSVSDEGFVLESKDGKPAYLWHGKANSSGSGNKYKAIRAKGTGTARPLLARKVTTDGKTDIGYFDPRWRADVAAVFVNNEKHFSNLSRAEWKPDTWFDLNYWRGHWIAWQLEETDKPETGLRFRASPVHFAHRKTKELFGVGVVGEGKVTVQAFFNQ